MNGIRMAVVIIGIAVGSSAVMGLVKKKIFTDIYLALNSRDYNGFFEKVDAKWARAMLPEYSRENMKLSAYMRLDDAKKVSGQFNNMMKNSMNSSQLAGLLVRGYDYFFHQMDGTKCDRIYEKMKEVLDPKQLEKYKRHNEIVFWQSTEYTEQLEAEVNSHRGKMKGYLEYLLSVSYGSAGNKETCENYLKKAAEEYKINAAGIEKQIQIM